MHLGAPGGSRAGVRNELVLVLFMARCSRASELGLRVLGVRSEIIQHILSIDAAAAAGAGGFLLAGCRDESRRRQRQV